MSTRANPTTIGLFMIGAVVLLLAGIGAFASTSLFDERTTMISYFEESVNGLEVGAPVKFKGVPIGQVKDLLIRIDMDAKTFQVPVVYDVDLNRLRTEGGDFVDLTDPEVRDVQVAAGLRAKLQMQSFVTGQLYVELTYVPDPGPVDLTVALPPHPVIPTEPSLLTSLSEEADSLVAGLQGRDIGNITRNLSTFLSRANEKLAALDVAELNASLTATAQAFEELAQAPELREALGEVPDASRQFTRTLAEMQTLAERLGGAVDPVQLQLETTNAELVETLRALRTAVEETQLLLSPTSGLGYRLEEALVSMSAAADALNRLASSLEQNPSMLIRGQAPPEDQDDE